MRGKAVQRLNQYLGKCNTPKQYWLDENDPAELAKAMTVGSEKWRRWQTYRAKKPGLSDREVES